MAFDTKSSAPRTKDIAEVVQEILTFSENADGSGKQIQGIALTGDQGSKTGIVTNPLYIQGAVLSAIKTALDSLATETTLEAVRLLLASRQETPPTDTSKFNPSKVLTYIAGDLTQIDMTFGGETYRKTLTYVGGDLTAISAWSPL